MIRSNIGNKRTPYLFLIPLFVVIAVFKLYPVYSNLIVSFYKFSPFELFDVSNFEFVGLNNYQDLFTSWRMAEAIKYTFIYLILVSAFLHVTALFIAKMLSSTYNLLKVPLLILFLIPFLTDGFVFPPNIYRLGYEVIWLLIGVVEMINNLGFYVFVYFIVLERVPKDIKEASILDGANENQVMRYIELPALYNSIKVMLLLSTVALLPNSPISQGYVIESGGFISAFTVMFILWVLIMILILPMLNLVFKKIFELPSHILIKSVNKKEVR